MRWLLLSLCALALVIGMTASQSPAQTRPPEPVLNPPSVFPPPGPEVLYIHSTYQNQWVRRFNGNRHYGATRLSPSRDGACDSVDTWLWSDSLRLPMWDTIFFWADTTISARRQPGRLLGWRTVQVISQIPRGVYWWRARFSPSPQAFPTGDFWLGYCSENGMSPEDSIRICVDTTRSAGADTTRNVVQIGNRNPGSWIMPIPSRCDWALTAFIRLSSGVEQELTARGSHETPQLAIRPNPFASFASVPGRERERFALYDISGREVGTYRGDRIGEGLKAGVYFLRSSDNKDKPLRIVKVR